MANAKDAPRNAKDVCGEASVSRPLPAIPMVRMGSGNQCHLGPRTPPHKCPARAQSHPGDSDSMSSGSGSPITPPPPPLQLVSRPLRICRFCLDCEDAASIAQDEGLAGSDAFVTPCPCRGSAKHVHLDCLVQHFVAQGDWHNFRCPTCKQPYEGRALRELAELSRDKMEQEYGAQAPQVAHSLCYLAQAHAQLGNTRESKEILERGLLISEAHFGRGHVATAATLAELASAHGKLGDVQKQKELLERSLEIKEQHFGTGHINTAVTLNNLATAHSELGNVQQEKVLLERSLEIKERHYGKGHVQTTAALVNLAGVYSELGDVSRGLTLLEWSLQIEERHFGAGHVETAITLNNLALACGEGGDMNRMRELLLKSLGIKERHFGYEHQELCLTLANLGMACSALGEEATARAYCSRALKACYQPEALSSRRHGVVLLRTASVLLVLGDEPAASACVQKAVATLRKALGGSASTRVLELECTRMSRIWAAVKKVEVIQRLKNFALAYDLDSEAKLQDVVEEEENPRTVYL